MATPSFSVTGVSASSFTINVKNGSGYYLRFYVRTTGGTEILDYKWVAGSASGNARYVSGLSEGTTYVVNVAYNTTASADGSTWIGGKYITTAETYNVSFTTKGVSCDLYWYTGSNAYKTTSLSLESESTSFTARTKDGDDYVSGAKNITCLDGYTTPITWQYNDASGATKTTTIANGGKNTIDVTSYNRTIYVYATKKSTTSTLTISMGTGVASWKLYKSGSYVGSGTSSTTVKNLTIGASYTVTFTASSGYTFSGSSTKSVSVTISSSGSSASSGNAQQVAYLTISKGTGISYYYVGGVKYTGDGVITTYVGDTVNIYSITVTNSSYYKSDYGTNTSVYMSSTSKSITLTATVIEYTFYYEVDRYIDGTYSLSATGNTTGDYYGAYVALSTAQGKVDPGGNYNYSTCAAGNNATWQSSYSRFYITSKSSSSRSILKLYYVSKSFSVSASRSGYEKAISSVSVSASTASYGSSVTFSAALYDGARFVGWYNASGTLQSTSRTYSKTITADTTLYARAVLDSFAWTYAKSTGSYKLSLEEWTRLQNFINRKRTSAYSFTATGDYLTAAMYNQIVAAIGTGTSVKRGQGISAVLLNALVTNANNM